MAQQWSNPGKTYNMNQQQIKKIFIVDDDPYWVAILAQILKINGYEEVQTFSSGKDCLDNLHQHPELILLDHSMDLLNGVDVLRKIKRFDPDINVVFISSQADIEVAVTSLKYGAFDYIVKGSEEAVKLPKVLNRIAAAQSLIQKKRKWVRHGLF
mgnify:CR=1 FL=1